MKVCGSHLDEVLGKLEENFGIEQGPVQHNWKNPDKDIKGKQSFPQEEIPEPWEADDGMAKNDCARIRIPTLPLYNEIFVFWPTSDGLEIYAFRN